MVRAPARFEGFFFQKAQIPAYFFVVVSIRILPDTENVISALFLNKKAFKARRRAPWF